MYSEIQVDISYFNQDTKQNSATCQNAENPQSISSIISSINTSLTEAVLNWSLSCFAIAARCLFYCKIHVAFYVVWSAISSHFCLVAFWAVQVWWLCVHVRQSTMQCHWAKATQAHLRKAVPDFAVEKTSGSTAQQSQNTMSTNSAHFQLNTR